MFKNHTHHRLHLRALMAPESLKLPPELIGEIISFLSNFDHCYPTHWSVRTG